MIHSITVLNTSNVNVTLLVINNGDIYLHEGAASFSCCVVGDVTMVSACHLKVCTAT